MGSFITSIVDGLSNVENWIEDLVSAVGSVFADVNFSDLWLSYLPQDISTVLAGVLLVMIFLAIVGIIKKISFFLG